MRLMTNGMTLSRVQGTCVSQPPIQSNYIIVMGMCLEKNIMCLEHMGLVAQILTRSANISIDQIINLFMNAISV